LLLLLLLRLLLLLLLLLGLVHWHEIHWLAGPPVEQRLVHELAEDDARRDVPPQRPELAHCKGQG